MYSLGSKPITFEVDGLRFGCALGMDGHFQEVFAVYESLDVDCVAFSTKGGFESDGPVIAREAQGFAVANSYPVSFSVPAGYSSAAAAGLISSEGEWSARCRTQGRESTV
jgi:predicted amidohydrolase